MANKIILKVVADTIAANKDMNKLSNETKGATAETTLLSGAMNSVRAAMTKVKAASKLLFGSIKAGLISTGIGAFVVVIGSLISYFTNTKKGAEALEVAFAAVGAAISVITDRISKIGGAIVKVFKGDFKGAAKDAKAAVSGVTDEIIREGKEMIELTKKIQALKDAERDFAVQKAQTRQEIEKARLAAEDESLSTEVRLENLKRALELEAETTAEELELQRQRVAAKQEEVDMSKSKAEDLDALNAEKIKLIELETASIKMRRRVVTEVNSMEREIAAEAKARAKEKADAEAEVTKAKEEAAAKQKAIDDKILADKEEAAAKQKAIDDKILADKEALKKSEGEKLLAIQQENALLLIEDANERALAQIDIERQRELDSVADTEHAESLKAAINEKYNKKKQAQNKATSDAERKLQIGDLGAVSSVLGSMADMQNEGTASWKTTKIAEARINSFMSASSAYQSMVGIPIIGQVLAPIAAAIALAQGQKQVEQIKATEIPKMARGGLVGGYGSGTSDSVNARLSKGEVVINAKSAKMFRGALSNMNVAGGGVAFAKGGATTPGDAGSFAGISTEPVKAFVLTDEMSSSQAKLDKIRRRSKL